MQEAKWWGCPQAVPLQSYPQLHLSLGKCRLALAHGLKRTSATSSHTPPSLLVLALLYADLCAAIHIFVRYLP